MSYLTLRYGWRANKIVCNMIIRSIATTNRSKGKCDSMRSGSRKDRLITMKTLNQRIIKLEYAVRGPLVTRSIEIKKELLKGAKKPFKEVINVNLGDAQAMGQPPITFFRQVISCVAYPDLIKKADFPEDVKHRANELLCSMAGQSAGSYTMSTGIDLIRKRVADFIERRDGHPCEYKNIIIGGGASTVINYVLNMFSNNRGKKPSGVMIPIPQYPLYSASLEYFGLSQIPYYLDEDNIWGLDVSEMERALKEGNEHSDVRAVVIINPGNPTGQVLTKENIEEVIKFAYENKLFIFADEVYQDNIYAPDRTFYSFKKVMSELGSPYKDMELASFNSISKGFVGECGMRAGWMEFLNIDPDVEREFLKAISSNLCSSVLGQVVIDCLAKPPAEGEPSYDLFCEEKNNILESLRERSILVVEAFNKMKGFKCNPVQGAMYAFPRFELSEKAIEAAKKDGKKPDVFYAFKLLEETGICIVAGSGFGQKPDTYHFRTTILAQTPLMKTMLAKFEEFHEKFTEEYS